MESPILYQNAVLWGNFKHFGCSIAPKTARKSKKNQQNDLSVMFFEIFQV